MTLYGLYGSKSLIFIFLKIGLVLNKKNAPIAQDVFQCKPTFILLIKS